MKNPGNSKVTTWHTNKEKKNAMGKKLADFSQYYVPTRHYSVSMQIADFSCAVSPTIFSVPVRTVFSCAWVRLFALAEEVSIYFHLLPLLDSAEVCFLLTASLQIHQKPLSKPSALYSGINTLLLFLAENICLTPWHPLSFWQLLKLWGGAVSFLENWSFV